MQEPRNEVEEQVADEVYKRVTEAVTSGVSNPHADPRSRNVMKIHKSILQISSNYSSRRRAFSKYFDSN